MKIYKYLYLIFIFIVIYSAYAFHINYKNSSISYPVSFSVPPKSTLNDVLDTLISHELIKNRLVFKIYNKVSPYSTQLKPGIYDINAPLPAIKIIKKIVAGKVRLEKITLPEGFYLRDIVDLISEKLQIPMNQLKKIVFDSTKVYSLTRENSFFLEGYLFPETYHFAKGISAEKVLKTMSETLFEKFDTLWQNRPEDFKYTFHETLTLASIIEKEILFHREYDTVSSVYHNRLKKRMKLQADPTVQYLYPEQKERLLYKDLEIDSPYNTYLYYGLPPGPIGTVSFKAMKAAIYPAFTPYYYFVADIDGYHIFSKSLKEHNSNKEKIKRKRRRMK